MRRDIVKDLMLHNPQIIFFRNIDRNKFKRIISPKFADTDKLISAPALNEKLINNPGKNLPLFGSTYEWLLRSIHTDKSFRVLCLEGDNKTFQVRSISKALIRTLIRAFFCAKV